MPSINCILPDFDKAVEYLEHLRGAVDLRPVAEAVAKSVWQDNAQARLAGVDKDGEPLKPIGSPPADPKNAARTRRQRVGDGPPLAPFEGSSRVVQGFDYRLDRVADAYNWVITFGWPYEWVEYHARGEGRNGPGTIAVRDIGGLRPEGRAKAAEAFRVAVGVAFSGGR